jgi:AhpD family alkylhydroperoxidase
MKNIATVLPEATMAMYALNAAARSDSLPESTVALAQLRASQINGCSVCCDMHSQLMKKAGETDQRLFAVAAWRDAPFFTDPERAALALAECLTRLADRPDPVPDDVWNEAAGHFDERAMAALIAQISAINVWNRWNVATRQPAGSVRWT